MKEKMQRLIVLIICILSVIKLVNAQGLMVLDESKTTQYILQYNQNQNDSSFSNTIVKDIAVGIQKNKELLRFSINYHWRIQLYKQSSRDYELILKLDSLSLEGDYLYKAFSVLEIIKPYNIFASILLNDLNSVQIKEFKQQIDGSKKDIALHFSIEDSSKLAFWKLSSFEVIYSYSPIQRNEFQEFIKQTDNYFTAYKKLNEMDAQLKSFDLNNTTMIPLYNVDLRDMEKEILELTPDKKVNLLSLSSKDPENYLIRYDSVSSRIVQLRNNFNAMVSAMDLEFLNKGKNLELQGNQSEALRYYKKSIAVNPNFCPAFLALSSWYLKNDSIEQSCKTLHYLLDSLKPDFETRNQALNFSETLLEKINKRGEELNKKELYLEAVDNYTYGIWFCNNTKGFSCTERMLNGMKQSKYGLYNSYLVIARKAFEKHKYDMVEEYLKYAIAYQKLNSSEIPNTPEVDKMFVQLGNLSLLKAQKQIEQKDYSEALLELDHTEKIAQNQQQKDERLNQEIFEMRKIAHQGVFDEMLAQTKQRKNSQDQSNNEVILKKAIDYKKNNQNYVTENAKSDSTQLKLKRSMYRHHIESGIGFLESSNYSTALEAFKNAKKIENDFAVLRDPNLIILMGRAAKPDLIERIKDGKLKAWASRFEEATQIYRAAQVEIEEYQLKNDPELSALMNELLAKIQNNLCSLVAYDFRAAMQKGFLNADLRDYLNASIQWNKAIEFARLNPSCAIDTNLPSNLLVKYYNEIQIQSANQKCYAFLASNDLDSFLFYYNQSYSLHKSNPEKYRLISIPQLLEVCKNNSKNEILLIKSIEYLLQNQRIEESFHIFLMLPVQTKTSIVHRDLFLCQAKIIALYDQENKRDKGKLHLFQQRFSGKNIPWFFKTEYLKEIF